MKNFTINITQYVDYDSENVENINFIATTIKDNKFKVLGKNGKFYWTVFATREYINTEPLKKDVNIKGEGPYKWI